MALGSRFEGEAGRKYLVESLREQFVVKHSPEVADALAAVGELVVFRDGDTLIEQGGGDMWAYFILSGTATVFVNNRYVGTRGHRELVGEMVAFDPAAPRSATIKSEGEMVAWRVAGSDLQDVADTYPIVWKGMGQVLADRLRARSRFHRPANEIPIMFVGCSVEGLDIAREVQQHFKHDEMCVRIWTDAVFGPGAVPIDNLLAQVHEADFALFVFTPDDKLQSRDTEFYAPRDNVIFEMGLFMDRLERHRTFMLKEHRLDLKIPTDLTGTNPLTYVSSPRESLTEQLAPTCHELRKLVRGLGAL